MYHPTLEEVKNLYAEHSKTTSRADFSSPHGEPESGAVPIVPLYRDLLADLETPVSVYCKAARGSFCFLLESVIAGERMARYSLIGVDPHMIITQRGNRAVLRQRTTDTTAEAFAVVKEFTCHDPLQLVQAELDRHTLIMPDGLEQEMPRSFYGGAVGYLAYEAVACFEQQLTIKTTDELDLPLANFCFTDTVLVFDHLKHRIRVVTHLRLDAPDLEAEYLRGAAKINEIQQRLQQELYLSPNTSEQSSTGPVPITASCTREEYEERVRRAQDYIRAGDIFQVVPSLRLSRPVTAEPLTVYRALRAINPSPYMFYLDLDDFQIVGASPELLIRVEDGEVTTRPIAGTRPRGVDVEHDQQFAEDLQADTKERAEHVMLVDLGRNDVGRVSQQGSVHITEFMTIERYSHVMHLVSNVQGKLREDVSTCDALRAGFPAGTVSGAPKIRAMEILSELEGIQRGVYAGAVGSFSYKGNVDTAITLRTIVIKNGNAYVQAGAGIVADSQPTAEYQECMNKARALLHALDEAEQMPSIQSTHTPQASGGIHAAAH